MNPALSAVHFHSEEAAYEFAEARLWPDGPVCPHCGATKEHSGKLKGKTNRVGLYKCYACRKPFTVKIGTVFESSHVPMRVWLQAIYLFCSSKKGISTRQLQRTFSCGLKTAWFLGHRVREAMTELNLLDSSPLGGANQVVEADETFVGGKARNRKNVIPPKAPVLSLVERDGRVRSFVVPNVTSQTLKPIIFWHTNTVENFFSIFKRGIFGCYFHVSEQHLHRYAAEFDFRYNNRIALGVDDLARADQALIGVKGKRLTYRTTGLSRRP